MPRFAILEHDWPVLHWDLLLEEGAQLLAWRLLAQPVVGEEVRAEANFPHRLFYLDHEGPVSGGRGTVARWDAGTFAWLGRGEDQLVVGLHGSKLQCRCTLKGDRCRLSAI